MKRIFLLSTLFLSAPAYAGDFYLHTGGFSYHLQERQGKRSWREVNNNIGLEYSGATYSPVCNKLSVTAETYLNSYDKRSNALYESCKYNLRDNVRLGLGYGVVSGYPNYFLLPMVTPFMEYDIKKLTAEAGFLPTTHGVFYIKFKWKY